MRSSKMTVAPKEQVNPTTPRTNPFGVQLWYIPVYTTAMKTVIWNIFQSIWSPLTDKECHYGT